MLLPTATSLRYASTAPAPPSPSPAAEAAPPSSLDSITLESIDLSTAPDVSNIPEQIGFLHQIGIEYGWGPTSTLQWVLEHIHVYSGLPWWGSIAVTALALRVVLFPLYVRSSDLQARQAALNPLLKPMMTRMNECRQSGDSAGMQTVMLQMQTVRSRAGLSYSQQFMPIIFQTVLGYCGFKLLRAMSQLPVPGFRDGGFAWLSDLTLPDPWGIMPLLMGASMHLIIRVGGESGAATPDQLPAGMKPIVLYAMPGFVILVMAWQPGALCVWFAASGALGMAQGLMLRNKGLRQYLGLAPMYQPRPEEQVGNPLTEALRAFGNERQPTGTPRREVGDSARTTHQGPPRPQWQAPNLNYTPPSGSGKIIDVKPSASRSSSSSTTAHQTARNTTHNEEMLSAQNPPPKAGGFASNIISRARKTISDAQEAAREKVSQRQEQARRDAKKKAIADYEKRARQRGR